MKWTGIPAVPSATTAELSQFLQAVKNNLESAKTEIETPTTSTTTTTTVSTGSGRPSIVDYGGINDGVANNDAAFLAAEASAYDEILIPEGVFKCNTRTQSQFNKLYYGPGLILSADGAAMPGTFKYLAADPTLWPTQGTAGYFRGDIGLNRGEWKIIGPGARTQGASTRYFDHAFQGRTCWFFTYDGSSGFQTQTAVPRTHSTQDYILVRNFGAYGDVYGSVVRMEQRWTPSASQTHWFATSTVGQYGGDINFLTGSSGTAATGWESMYIDQGNDVTVIAQVDSFVRDNDTGDRGCVWLGTYFQSTGSKPADAAHCVAGRWRVGLDTVRANLDTFLTTGDNFQCAINTKLGHKWIMNSTSNTSFRGGDPTFGTFYGNVPGDMFIESGNDGEDFIAIKFNRVAPNDGRLRVRPGVIQMNKQLQVGGAINGATDLSLGGQTGGVASIVFGAGSGNYILWDGTAFRFYKGGVLASSI